MREISLEKTKRGSMVFSECRLTHCGHTVSAILSAMIRPMMSDHEPHITTTSVHEEGLILIHPLCHQTSRPLEDVGEKV